MVNLSSMQLILPSYKKIRLRSGFDRYGHSHVFSRALGLPVTPRSFGNWVHGWTWAENPTLEDLNLKGVPKESTVVVRNELERAVVVGAGYCDVRAGGLPFCYVPQQHESRVVGALVAFPHHSTESEKVDIAAEEYFDWLHSIRKDFSHIFVCLHHFDVGGPMEKVIVNRGLSLIRGARPDDANSTFRMRAILDSFEFATSNILGSHFIYSGFSGCKVSLSGPYSITERRLVEQLISYGIKREDPRFERILHLYSEACMRKLFPEFIFPHPKSGVVDKSYFSLLIGENFMLSPDQLMDALGWTVKRQIVGYVRGLVRKAKRVTSFQH
jgi:hypothetical protein